MGFALSLKNLSWLSYLDHQAINAKDFEFLSQLLIRNKKVLVASGSGRSLTHRNSHFLYFCCFIQAMVSLFFEDMSNKAPNKDFFLAI